MPLCLLPSYHPHPSCAIFMYSYFLYYTSIRNCVLSLFSTSSHILTLTHSNTLFSWRTTSWCPVHKADDGSSKNHCSSFQIRLPGAVFFSFLLFLLCSPQTHGLPIRALRHSHSSLRLICPLAARFSSTDLSFTPWRLQRAEQRNHKESVAKEPHTGGSDDYVETEGEGPSGAAAVYGSQN